MIDLIKRARRIYKKVYRFLMPLLFLPFIYLIKLLPFRIAVRLGTSAGDLFYGLLKKEREKTLKNLRLVFRDELREEEIRDLSRRCFQHFGRSFVEFLHAPRFLSDVEKRFFIENKEHIDSLLSAGKGGILITAHTGNWELCAFFLKKKGYPINVVARKLHYPIFNRLLIGYRERFGINTVLRGEKGDEVDVRQIVTRLKRGEFFAFLIDQDMDVRGDFVPFFDLPAYSPFGPALIAIKLGVPTLTGFMARHDDERYTLFIEGPPIYPAKVKTEEEINREAERLTTLWNRMTEEHIRRFPEQWVWMHERWKRAEREGMI